MASLPADDQAPSPHQSGKSSVIKAQAARKRGDPRLVSDMSRGKPMPDLQTEPAISGTCSASAPARQTMTLCPRLRKRGVTLVAYGSEITTGNHARLTARRRCACDACSRGSRSPFDSCGPNGWPARCGARTSHSQIMVGARLKKGVSVARNRKCAAAVRASVSKFDRQGNYECAA